MTGRNESSRPLSADVPSAGEAATPGRVGAETPVPPAQARTWRIELPASQELLTSNTLGNWGKRHRIGTPIKNAVITLARKAKIPHLDRISIVVEFQPPTGRSRVVLEAHNLGPSAKPAIDGLTQAGVITDDSDKYVAEVTFRSGPKHPGGRIVLIITELLPTDEEPAP